MPFAIAGACPEAITPVTALVPAKPATTELLKNDRRFMNISPSEYTSSP
jgi:hypothetical protein